MAKAPSEGGDSIANSPEDDPERQKLKSRKKNKKGRSDDFAKGSRRHKDDSGSSDENGDYPVTDPDYGETCLDKWEGEKWIWNEADLKRENEERDSEDELPCIKRLRHDDVRSRDTYGIRSHPSFSRPIGWAFILKSFYVPWHNEFLSLWFYLIFAIYFWVQTFLIMGHEHHYVFVKQHDFDFMWIACLGISVSLTCTFVYLLFYSLSEKWY